MSLSSEDCDDNDNSTTNTNLDDADCDGISSSEDCDDNDNNIVNMNTNDVRIVMRWYFIVKTAMIMIVAPSTRMIDDADCDGILSSEDCDDNDNNIANTNTNDADCDGISTNNDVVMITMKILGKLKRKSVHGLEETIVYGELDERCHRMVQTLTVMDMETRTIT